MYSVNLKKPEQHAAQAPALRERIYPSKIDSAALAQAPKTSRETPHRLRFACFKIDKAQRHQYSTFDVGRSMFDVQGL